jgi:hypothetical protein
MGEQAYKPGSVPGLLQAATISLGRPSPDASSSLPGDAAGRLISPYVTLHQAGFAQVSGRPEPRALLPHDCTLADGPPIPSLTRANRRTTPTGGMFLWHFPWGRPPLGVTQRLALWCPDFPLQACACSNRPACSRPYRIIRTGWPQTAAVLVRAATHWTSFPTMRTRIRSSCGTAFACLRSSLIRSMISSRAISSASERVAPYPFTPKAGTRAT